MPFTIQHGTFAAAAVALGLSAFAATRGASAPTEPAATARVSTVAPPPQDHCQAACDSIPSWCLFGQSVNCALRLRELEQSDARHFSCAEPIDPAWFDTWCPNHGEQHPIPIRHSGPPTLIDNMPVLDGGIR